MRSVDNIVAKYTATPVGEDDDEDSLAAALEASLRTAAEERVRRLRERRARPSPPPGRDAAAQETKR